MPLSFWVWGLFFFFHLLTFQSTFLWRKVSPGSLECFRLISVQPSIQWIKENWAATMETCPFLKNMNQRFFLSFQSFNCDGLKGINTSSTVLAYFDTLQFLWMVSLGRKGKSTDSVLHLVSALLCKTDGEVWRGERWLQK